MRLSLRRIEFTPSNYNNQRSTYKSINNPTDSKNSPNSSNSSSSNGSSNNNFENKNGAILRRKRHRACKTNSRTIHPAKTNNHKPAIEKLMKLILEQGETIQQQLTQLR